jgi:probable HAF family extracellular repeat protein
VNKEATVKTKGRLMLITAMILFAALAMPVRLAAQDNHENHNKQHHYQFFDLGTFGGPISRNDGTYPALNDEGTVIGLADTTTPDPFYPNGNPLILPGGASDPYIFRTFESINGQLVALDSLPGGYSTAPVSISTNGLIAGEAMNGALDPVTGWPEENAVFWQNGKITNLGTLGGYESASSMVNNRGQVAGFSSNAIPDPHSLFGLGTQTRAFLWDERNGMQDIGTLGGPDAVSTSINERGQIAGASFTSDMAFDPFLWEPPTGRHPNGEMIDLGSLGGTFGFEGDGVALNNHGQVVGVSNLAGDVYSHPFLWTKPGPMQDLGTVGGNFGMANAINDAGEVVGWATNAGDQALFAFLWRNGIMTNLGVLPGKLCSYAHQINAEGQVTGSSDDDCNDGNSHAFLWENGGPMVDLNDLVSGADMTLGGATGINDRGEITGIGVLANGDAHVFLLIPCDEHHLGLEGCDYNLVNASAAAASGLTAKRQTSLNVDVRKALQQQLGHRYHLPILQGPRD